MNKEVRQLLAEAEHRGFRVKTGSKHVKIFGKEGLVTVLPKGTKLNTRNHRAAAIALRKATP